jgi:8-oxo-dGTP pyrophosphatase MutT (NUDIX family)
MEEEYLDIIDINNSIINKATKSDAHQNGLRHRVSAVLLKREDGKYLFPTASNLKVESGKLFHSSAGHVCSGESYMQTAIRELEEECGIKVNQVKLLDSFCFEYDYENRIEKERFEIFEAEYIKSMGEIILNSEQVNEKWLSLDQLQKIFIENPEQISLPLQLTCKQIFNFK